jgi:hypothetical protein
MMEASTTRTNLILTHSGDTDINKINLRYKNYLGSTLVLEDFITALKLSKAVE